MDSQKLADGPETKLAVYLPYQNANRSTARRTRKISCRGLHMDNSTGRQVDIGKRRYVPRSHHQRPERGTVLSTVQSG